MGFSQHANPHGNVSVPLYGVDTDVPGYERMGQVVGPRFVLVNISSKLLQTRSLLIIFRYKLDKSEPQCIFSTTYTLGLVHNTLFEVAFSAEYEATNLTFVEFHIHIFV